jgi:citrate lyase subunit beta/citryl-CoA lyase
MMGKGPNIPADMIFLDLEDACAPSEKEAARGKIVSAIRDQDWGDRVLCVRVNDWSTKWTAFDIIEVVGKAGDRLDEIMLPKVESAAQIVATRSRSPPACPSATSASRRRSRPPAG